MSCKKNFPQHRYSVGHGNNKGIYLTEAGSLNDVSTVGTKSRSRGAKKRRNEKRKLRDVDRCRREKGGEREKRKRERGRALDREVGNPGGAAGGFIRSARERTRRSPDINFLDVYGWVLTRPRCGRDAGERRTKVEGLARGRKQRRWWWTYLRNDEGGWGGTAGDDAAVHHRRRRREVFVQNGEGWLNCYRSSSHVNIVYLAAPISRAFRIPLSSSPSSVPLACPPAFLSSPHAVDALREYALSVWWRSPAFRIDSDSSTGRSVNPSRSRIFQRAKIRRRVSGRAFLMLDSRIAAKVSREFDTLVHVNVRSIEWRNIFRKIFEKEKIGADIIA